MKILKESLKSRKIETPEKFFDILDSIKRGSYITIGYVTGANLAMPKVKRINPASNRMKSYDDYSAFGNEEIGALVKISAWNFRYQNREDFNQTYTAFKQNANVVRGKYGLDPIADKENGYKEKNNFGKGGVDTYNGKNNNLQGHSYIGQNGFGIKPKSITYAVDTNGHIIKALTPEEIKPFIGEARPIDGVAALRKMGADEEKIKQYIQDIKALKFSYKNFESDSILWIATTIKGMGPIVYINNNLKRIINDININPQDFINIARERYQVELQDVQNKAQQEITESKRMNKKLVKLTEMDLHRIVEETTKQILKEAINGGWEVDTSEAQEAYEMAVNSFGEETINSAIVRSLGDETLAQCLAYIFRQYDFREWANR
jgi:hypothetical protein